MKELKIYLYEDGKLSCFFREERVNYYKEISADEAKKILGEHGFGKCSELRCTPSPSNSNRW
jgi:hypothetical protein